MSKLAPLATVRHTLASGFGERIEVVPTPSYPEHRFPEYIMRAWGQSVSMSIIGPKGGVRFCNDLSPTQARALAYALLQSADWAELEGQYVNE